MNNRIAPRIAALFLGGFISLLFPISVRAAKPDIKHLVFEDCTKATAALHEIPADELPQLLTYLGRILDLSVQNVNPSAIDVPPMGISPGTGFDLRGMDMWKTLDPSHELEAKKCAAGLLRTLAPLSGNQLPRFAEALLGSTLPGELRQQLEESAYAITRAVRMQTEKSISDEAIAELVRVASKPDGFIAGNIIIDLQEKSIPQLLNLLTLGAKDVRDTAEELLLRIDDDSGEVRKGLIQKISSGDDDVRRRSIRMAARLPAMHAAAVPELIRLLGDPSTIAENALYDTLSEILRVPANLSSVKLSAAELQHLVIEFEKQTPGRREVLEKALRFLPTNSEEVSKLLLAIPLGEDEDLDSRTLLLLGYWGGADQKTTQLLIDKLYEPSVRIRLSAIHGLAAHPDFRDQKAAALIKKMKSLQREVDPQKLSLLTLAIAEAVAKLSLDKLALPMAPYFMDCLGTLTFPATAALAAYTPESGPAAEVESLMRVLLSLGEGVRPLIVKSLRHKNPVVRLFATRMISELKPISANSVQLLVSQLKDLDLRVREAAFHKIVELGTLAQPELERALKWKEADAQLMVARLITKLIPSNTKATQILHEGVRRASCAEKSKLVLDLLHAKNVEKSELEGLLLQCLERERSYSLDIISALAQLKPLSPSAAENYLRILEQGTMGKRFITVMAQVAPSLGVPPTLLTKTIQALILKQDDSVRARLLITLGRLGRDAREASPLVKEIAEESNAQNSLRPLAAAALSRIDPAAVDSNRILVAEFKKGNIQQVEKSLDIMDDAEALVVLEILLKEVSSEVRPQVLRIVCKRDAPGIVSLALPYLHDASVDTSYEALRVLLLKDPANPEIEKALRRQLLGPRWNSFSEEPFGEVVGLVLRRIKENPETYSQYRSATMVLNAQQLRQSEVQNLPNTGSLDDKELSSEEDLKYTDPPVEEPAPEPTNAGAELANK